MLARSPLTVAQTCYRAHRPMANRSARSRQKLPSVIASFPLIRLHRFSVRFALQQLKVRPYRALARRRSRLSGRRDGIGGLSSLTIRHAHRLLSKAFKEAARHDLVVRNVASDLSRHHMSRARRSLILTGEQVRTVVTRLQAHARSTRRVIVGLFTAMRRGEILALALAAISISTARRSHVRECARGNECRAAFQKGKERRPANVTSSCLRSSSTSLRDYRQQQFEHPVHAQRWQAHRRHACSLPGSTARRYPQRVLSKAWAAIASDIGLVSITFHALRHTHTSHAHRCRYRHRADHQAARAFVASTVTLDTYAHLFARREDKSAVRHQRSGGSLTVGVIMMLCRTENDWVAIGWQKCPFVLLAAWLSV